MYKCKECGATFDTPTKESLESFYGVSSDFNYSCGGSIELCPSCGSSYVVKEGEFSDNEEDDLMYYDEIERFVKEQLDEQ